MQILYEPHSAYIELSCVNIVEQDIYCGAYAGNISKSGAISDALGGPNSQMTHGPNSPPRGKFTKVHSAELALLLK